MSKYLSMRKGEVRDVDDTLAETLIAAGVAEQYNLIEPTGKITITENGNGIDVSQYAEADVNVPNPSTGTINITENGENIDVTSYAAANVNVQTPTDCTIQVDAGSKYSQIQFAAPRYGPDGELGNFVRDIHDTTPENTFRYLYCSIIPNLVGYKIVVTNSTGNISYMECGDASSKKGIVFSIGDATASITVDVEAL